MKTETIVGPLRRSISAVLRAGDEVLLSGTIYTARDQAHKRIVEALRSGRKPPFDLNGAVIYYCGPTATPRGRVIGSCGPTTSSRMDAYAPLLLEHGLSAMIGKGSRSEAVRQAIKKNKAVYFLAPAGCGAFLAQYVRRKRLLAYPDLGPEAVYALDVAAFPAIVAIDAAGRQVYTGKGVCAQAR